MQNPHLKKFLTLIGFLCLVVISATGKESSLSFESLEHNCTLGKMTFCSELGLRYVRGEGTALNMRKGFRLLEQSCDRNVSNACAYLGMQYRIGQSIPRNIAKGKALLARACDLGQGSACLDTAYLYDEGKVDSPYGSEITILDDTTHKKAAEYYNKGFSLSERECNAGGGEACFNLASLYLLGKGIQKDENKGRLLIARSCSLGYNTACTTLSDQAKKASLANAITRLEQECNSGAGASCFLLGTYFWPKPDGRMFIMRSCVLGYDYGCAAINTYK